MLSRSKGFLENAVTEQQTSAVGFLLRRPSTKDVEWYLGSTGRKEQGAASGPVQENSIFDLASVSKLLGTTSLLFTAESEGKISFADKVQKYFPFPSGETTLLDLMAHKSGLPAHIEYFRYFNAFEEGKARLGDQSQLASWIVESGLPNLGKQVYSDLGFMLLGLILEKVYGKTLPEIFHERISSRLKLESTGYCTLPHAAAGAKMFGLLAPRERFVATEICPWRKKTLQGEVHDDNCWALGGYAGHAGLFSTPREAATLLEHVWKKAQASPDFLQREAPGPGVFSFGFSTYPGLRPFPGNAFHPSYGHTGYTGTSVWLHPSSGTMSILFSNRVHPARTDDRWIQTRLEFHKILWEELGL